LYLTIQFNIVTFNQMKKKPKQKSSVEYVHGNGHETCNSFTLQTVHQN